MYFSRASCPWNTTYSGGNAGDLGATVHIGFSVTRTHPKWSFNSEAIITLRICGCKCCPHAHPPEHSMVPQISSSIGDFLRSLKQKIALLQHYLGLWQYSWWQLLSFFYKMHYCQRCSCRCATKGWVVWTVTPTILTVSLWCDVVRECKVLSLTSTMYSISAWPGNTTHFLLSLLNSACLALTLLAHTDGYALAKMHHKAIPILVIMIHKNDK